MSCIAMVLIFLLAGFADGLMEHSMACFIITSAIVLVIAALLIWVDNNFEFERRKRK